MSKPKIFISSTYIDLKQIRETLNEFISHYGYEPVLFEKGGIPFDYDKDTDISCYDEVQKADLYILIIGGRHGSVASQDKQKIHRNMKRYNSITRKEYQTALNSHIPMHIFVDQRVSSEYHTWKINKDKSYPMHMLIMKIYFNLLMKYTAQKCLVM